MSILARLILLLAISCSLTVMSRAEIVPVSVEKLKIIYASLDDLIRQKQANGKMPLMADPADALILRSFVSAVSEIAQPPFVSADIPDLLDALEMLNRVGKNYLLFTDTVGKLPATDVNYAVFQDEVTLVHTHIMEQMVRANDAVADFYSHLPQAQKTETRKQGLRQLRLGMQQLAFGASMSIVSNGMHADNQLKLAQAMAQHGAGLAKGLPQSDRDVLAAAMISARKLVPDPCKGLLDVFIDAMSKGACNGLCLVE